MIPSKAPIKQSHFVKRKAELLAVTSLEKDSIVDVFLEKLNFGSFNFTEMLFVSCFLELHCV